MRILFICSQSPAPAHAGAALRLLGWLGVTSRLAEVGLVVLTRSKVEDEAIRRLAVERGWWLRTTLAPRSSAVRFRDRLLALPGSRPHLLLAAHNDRFQEVVQHALTEFRPDIVQAEQIAATQYLPVARNAGVPTVYSAHNIEHRILAGPSGLRAGFQVGSRAPGRASLRRRAVEGMRSVEETAARSASAVVAVSPEEAQWLGRTASRVVTVPNAVELNAYPFRPPSERPEPHLLFTGHLGYPPNRAAAAILARKVYPRVARGLPGARCVIAGANPGRSVRRLAGAGVDIEADFPSFLDLVRRSGVYVCPLEYGAGSRLKLLEAAAAGLPIVATPVSTEGLHFEAGRDYLAASEPTEMADSIVKLLRDQEHRESLARAARATVEEHHAWSGQRDRIAALYEDLVGDTGQG